MARSARCDVRYVAAVFVGSDETRSQQISSVLDTFRPLLLQIGGANIAGADRAWQPPTSSSLAEEERLRSILLSTTARNPGLIAPPAGARSGPAN
jgi:hypothetical protein